MQEEVLSTELHSSDIGPGRARAEHVELILQQLEQLPTLSPIASRILSLTTDERADVREIVRLIESDPSLTAKVLGLCQGAHTGLGDRITTVDRAVVMIGFDAVRNAVLSVEIYDLFAPTTNDENLPESHGSTVDDPQGIAGDSFDHVGFWMHSLAVAVSAELIAEFCQHRVQFSPSEAFVCGLLHGLGKLALEHLLPRSYARVASIADQEMTNIAEVERRVLGVDHHTAGKRLGELWGLPHLLQDVMWLYGQPANSLPDLEHQPMIGLVSLADHLARQQHIGYSGNHVFTEEFDELCRVIGTLPQSVKKIIPQIHERVCERAELLGLSDTPKDQILFEAIGKANQALGRINANQAKRTQKLQRNEQILQAISDFHGHATPGQTALSVCGHVVVSAAREFGRGFFAMLLPSLNGQRWRMCQFAMDGRVLRSEVIEPPASNRALESLSDDYQISVEMLGLLPWLSDCLTDCEDIRNVKLLPLRNGWGLSAVMLHDRNLTSSGLHRNVLRALCETWASAIAAAGQHEGARRLGEQLAESNRMLTEAQTRLAQSQVMAALGELAAGAAHEMNNPLTVISGRSQVLATQVADIQHRRMAEQIVDQTQRLTDLITSLHLFANPPQPRKEPVSLETMIGRIVQTARNRSNPNIPISVTIANDLPKVYLDREQVGLALLELIVNALESNPAGMVDVLVQTSPEDDRLMIKVRDDGVGMDPHTLAHAFDPFFSHKQAGRQPGLGLARAQRLIIAHKGNIELTSSPNKGTTAVIRIPLRKDSKPRKGRTAA